MADADADTDACQVGWVAVERKRCRSRVESTHFEKLKTFPGGKPTTLRYTQGGGRGIAAVLALIVRNVQEATGAIDGGRVPWLAPGSANGRIAAEGV